MPRAASGAGTMELLRRNIPKDERVSAWKAGRSMGLPSFQASLAAGSDTWTHKYRTGNFFTQQLSGFWVERGRLGEVVSLVGDCRPPPPGNPRRPSMGRRNRALRAWVDKLDTRCGELVNITSGRQWNGGIIYAVDRHHSFKYSSHPSNLKILNRLQNFKNKCSFYSCNGLCLVLEFGISHCHLYGLRSVGSPSIAITSVLRM